MADPLVVRLTLHLLDRGTIAVARAAGARRRNLPRVRRALECSPGEVAFARALLARRTNLWLFRASQRAASGDFLVVDVSEPRVAARRLLVLELKRGVALRRHSEELHQARNARAVVAAAARATRAVPADAPYGVLVGDPALVLDHLLGDWKNEPREGRCRLGGAACAGSLELSS